MQQLNLSNTLIINDEILSTDIDNELVLMSVETGNYFGLNSVGLRIWELLKTQTSITDLLTQLQEEFNVSKEQCEAEVLALLNKMLEKKLIKIV